MTRPDNLPQPLVPSHASSPSAMPRSVFVSYARADALDFATRLAADLEPRAGHRAWIDRADIEKGGLFEVRIEQGIRAADVVAAVLTRRSQEETSVCRDEVVFALNEGKPLVPLRLDPAARPTLLLARRNWIQEPITVFVIGSWPTFWPAQVRPNVITRRPSYSWRGVFGGIV